MKNVFKYLGIAARFVIDIIAALRAKRTAKKDSEQTLENLKRLYKNNGFDLLERSISLLSNKAAEVLHKSRSRIYKSGICKNKSASRWKQSATCEGQAAQASNALASLTHNSLTCVCYIRLFVFQNMFQSFRNGHSPLKIRNLGHERLALAHDRR